MALAHDALHLVVDALGGLGRVVLLVGIVTAEEHLVLGLAKDLRAKLVAHAVAGDHLAGQLGGTLQVVARAGGDVVAEELLGGAAAQQHGNLVEHAVARLEEVVLLGKRERIAERLASGDDRDLVHRVGVVEDVAHQGVAALVVGDGLALLGGHDAALALGTGDDALHGLLDLGHGDLGLVAARGEKGALVHEVHKVGAGEAGRELGQALEVDVGGQRLALGVHADDLLAAGDVGAVHRDLAVEAARAQQGGVEDVGTVGGRDEDHSLVGLEAVHLDEQLVERLLALVVTATQAGATLATDGIDLVDEDDGGAGGLGLLEEVAHAGGAHAHEHLHEVRARDGEEWHARLAGDGLGEQRLARARRAHEQHAARNLGTHLLEALGFGEEVADLLELLDGLVNAGHVGELDLGTGLLGGLGLGASEAHGLAVLVLHAAHEVDEHGEHQQRGHHGEHDRLEPLVAGVVHRVGDGGVARHQLGEAVGAGVGAREALELVILALVRSVLPVGAGELAGGGVVGERGDALVVDGVHDVARGDALRARAGGDEVRREAVDHVGDERDAQDDVEDAAAAVGVVRVTRHQRAARTLRFVVVLVVFVAHATFRKPPA